MELVSVAVVLDEGPELFRAVQLAKVVILQGLCLEILVDFRPEFPLQTVAIKPEQALQPISEKKLKFY